jgi:hypothetical protein
MFQVNVRPEGKGKPHCKMQGRAQGKARPGSPRQRQGKSQSKERHKSPSEAKGKAGHGSRQGPMLGKAQMLTSRKARPKEGKSQRKAHTAEDKSQG